MNILRKYKVFIYFGGLVFTIALVLIIKILVGNNYYEAGYNLFNAGNYNAAIEKYYKAEKWGSKEARFALGTILYNPYYADSSYLDYVRAEKLLIKSKRDGIEEANYHLGIMALKGLGTPSDINKAKEYFKANAGEKTGASRYQLYLLLQNEGNKKLAMNYLKESMEENYMLGKGVYGQQLFLNSQYPDYGVGLVKAASCSEIPLINYYLMTDYFIKSDHPDDSCSISSSMAISAEERTLSGRPNIPERLMNSTFMVSPFDVFGWSKHEDDEITHQLVKRGYKIIKKDSICCDFMAGMRGDTITISIRNDGNFTMGVTSFYPRSSSIFYCWLKNLKDRGISVERLGYLNSDIVLMKNDTCSFVLDNGSHTLRSWIEESDLVTDDDVKNKLLQAYPPVTVVQQNGHYLYTASDAKKTLYFNNLRTGEKHKYDKQYKVIGVTDSIIYLDNDKYLSWIHTPTNTSGKTDLKVIGITDKNLYCQAKDGTLAMYSRNPWSETLKPDHRVIGFNDNRIALKHESNGKFALLDCDKNIISEMPNLSVLGMSGDNVACKDNTNSFVKYNLTTNKRNIGRKIFGVLGSGFLCVGDSTRTENGYKYTSKIIEKYDLNGNRVTVSFPETGDGEWINKKIDKMKFVNHNIMMVLKDERLCGPDIWWFVIYKPYNNSYDMVNSTEGALYATFVGDNVKVEYEGKEADDGSFDNIRPVITYNSDGEVISYDTKRFKDTFKSNWKKMYPSNQFGDPDYSSPFIRYSGPGYTVTISRSCMSINFGYSLQSVVRSVALKDSFGEVTQIRFLHSTLGGSDSIDIMGDESLQALINAFEAGCGSIAVDYEGFFVDSMDYFKITNDATGIREAIRRLIWEYENDIKAKI